MKASVDKRLWWGALACALAASLAYVTAQQPGSSPRVPRLARYRAHELADDAQTESHNTQHQRDESGWRELLVALLDAPGGDE